MLANETRLGAPGIPDIMLEAAETLVARETAKMRPSGTLNWLQSHQKAKRSGGSTADPGPLTRLSRVQWRPRSYDPHAG
ncbi:hypothetical protein GCM10009533_29270 [Saccharopolyspora spinosporotrichia]|uniref:Transposase n=1 Tax=Saccharopolyspora erythraea TaxID=1836 RepID=A0ABN1CWP1_SACER